MSTINNRRHAWRVAAATSFRRHAWRVAMATSIRRYAWRVALATSLFCAMALWAPRAPAQSGNYPSRPIRLVVPYSPGGNIDITARVVAQSLGEALGVAVVVENRAGVGGLLGASYVAHAPADGYTLLLGSSGSITTGPAVYRSVPFDPIKDFKPIGAVQTVPLVVDVSNKLPVRTIGELVEYSHAHGPVNAGISGVGAVAHLATFLMNRQIGLDTLNVPYKGAGPAMTDLIGGQVSMMVDQLNASLPFIQQKQVRVIVQLGAQRSSLLPDVPTLAEQGHPGFEASTFTGVFAPAGIAPDVEKALLAGLAKAMADPGLRKRFADMGADVMDMDQAAFTQFVAADLAKWKKIAHDANLVVD
jgi:tripartite-type tricarboxylate transporter receptor subunit TctC